MPKRIAPLPDPFVIGKGEALLLADKWNKRFKPLWRNPRGPIKMPEADLVWLIARAVSPRLLFWGSLKDASVFGRRLAEIFMEFPDEAPAAWLFARCENSRHRATLLGKAESAAAFVAGLAQEKGLEWMAYDVEGEMQKNMGVDKNKDVSATVEKAIRRLRAFGKRANVSDKRGKKG